LIPFSDSSANLHGPSYVNRTLIAISVLVFLYEISLSGFGIITGDAGLSLNLFFHKWGFIALELTSGDELRFPGTETPVHTVFTIFTSMFIHGGLMHLASNMMFLWVLGNTIEGYFGHVKYLVFYLLAGVAATLAQWAINTDSTVPLIGASGAISGVVGAYLIIFPNNKIKALIIFFLITAVEMRALWLLGAWFVWQLIQGSLSLGLSGSVSVAFFAHIGGFVAGMALAGMYKLVIGEPLIPRRSRGNPWDNWYQAGRPRD